MDYNAGIIDLHLHSTASDGSLTPEQIIDRAAERGLRAISITDHDTVSGAETAICLDIPETLKFIPGIEISTAYPREFENRGSLHILGYGIKTGHPELRAAMEKQRAERSNRNPKIIEKLNRTGIPISLEAVCAATGKTDLARPHIAEFLVAHGHAEDIDDAFDRFLGRGKPAYVDKYRIPAEKAIALIRKAGGIAVLAHPCLLLDFLADPVTGVEALVDTLVPFGLGGIEAFYPGQSTALSAYFEQLAYKRGLLVTGGTDFHGKISPDIEMGTGQGDFSVPYEIFRRLRYALPSP